MSPRLALLVALLVLPAAAAGEVADRADAAWDRGDLAMAETLYAQRLEQDPRDERALHRLALITAWDERFDRSLELFDRLLEVNPRNREAAVDRSRVLAWRGQIGAALESLDEILASAPSYVPALKARAQFLSWAGRTNEALATYDRLITDFPQDQTLWRDQARVLAGASRFEEAEALYGRLLEVDPQDRDALLGLAQVQAWSGQLESAELTYHRVLDVRPDDAEALSGLARLTAWRGRLVAAERQWRDVIAKHSEDPSGHVGLAQTLRWSGRTAAAVLAVDEAARLAPTDREVRQQMEWARLAMQPRIGSGLTFESDSDENDIATLTVDGGQRLTPSIELTGTAYQRTATLDGRERRRAYGATAYGLFELEPGWLLRGGLGLSSSNAVDSRDMVRALASIRSPGRYRGGGSLAYSRQPLDLTAQLIENGVWTQGVSANGWYAIDGHTRINGSTSLTRFEGSESNRRLAGHVAADRRLLPDLRLGVTMRAFGFEKNLQDGYFDPERYWLTEIVATWRPTVASWSFDLTLAPGLQRVGKDGSVDGAGRAAVQARYTIAPGREIGAFLRYSSAGVDSFSTASADWRSLAVGVSGSWVF